ncbi:MAG TPA: phosphoenolpyruvate carboxylase, partial [Caldilineaceae bacterium]|nr:phosphoenolpyruvate carboxylase [Caldilineaceae bacterium]
GAADRADRVAQLRTIYRDWPFFASILDNVQFGLCKGDIDIAELYAKLADEAVCNEIFGDLKAEFVRTKQMVLEITGYHELLDNEDWLQRSIKLRNPYVDPLNYVQVALLRRLQKERSNHTALLRAVSLSVNGIAAGLQNTG